MKKLGLVVGARPNFVKAAAVVRALEERAIKPILIHTGQHHDAALSDRFFQRFQLPKPDYHLGVQPGTRGEQAGEMITRLSKLIPILNLDELLVVGDVTSTLAGALAADACDLPVSHVEAGLRSFDMAMPEERNRKVVDAIAHRLFVSEPSGVENLKREGHADNRIFFVGNVMIDTLMRFREEAVAAAVWRTLGLEPSKYAVATLHRPSNVDQRDALAECLDCLRVVGDSMPIVFAVHPRTQVKLQEFGLVLPESIRLMPPLDYLDFISLMAVARVVLTDSGGAQEETTALGVPCLTMRENTERPVTCQKGSARLVGRSVEKVRESMAEIMNGRFLLGQTIPFWDGKAASRIADVLLS